MKKNMMYTLLAIASITPTIGHGYQATLTGIINKTEQPITFIGQELSAPMPVPMMPPHAKPGVAAPQAMMKESALLILPMTIPVRSHKEPYKRIDKQIITDEESKSGAEKIFTFKDKKGNPSYIIFQGNQILTITPGQGKKVKATLSDPQATYHVKFIFKGNDMVDDISIKTSKK